MMDAEMLGDIRRTLRDKEDPLPFSQQVALLDEVQAAQEETELLHAALHRHHEEIARLRAWERDARAAMEAAKSNCHTDRCDRVSGFSGECTCYQSALRAVLERKP